MLRFLHCFSEVHEVSLGTFTDKWLGFWQGFLNFFQVPTHKPLPFSFFRAKNILHSEHHCTDHRVRLCFSFMAKQQEGHQGAPFQVLGCRKGGSAREKLQICCIDDVPDVTQHLMEVGCLQPGSHHPEMGTWQNEIHVCMPWRVLAECLLRRV